MRSILKSKKANALADTALVIVFIFVLGIVGFYGFQIFSQVNDELQADSDLSTTAKDSLQQTEDNLPNLMDGIFILSLVILWIVVIALSYFIEASPLMYGVVFIVGVFLVFVGIALAEWATDFETDTENVAYAAQLPLTFLVLKNLPIYVIVLVFSSVVTLFAKEGAG